MATNPTTAPKPPPRQVGLDLLRLLAIAFVLGRHMPSIPESWPAGVDYLFFIWRRGGWVGVDLFFVLSGFLVSGLLFREYTSRGNLGIGRFYMRRGWKIYPPFFVLIAVTVLTNTRQGFPIKGSALIAELFFLQSYVGGLSKQTWSLAVEEHFYLLLPLTLAVMVHWNRRSPRPLRPVLALAVVIAVLTLGARVLNWYLRPSYGNLTHLFASHLRLDSLFFGVAISYLHHFHAIGFDHVFMRWRRFLIVGGALLLTPAFAFPLETTPFIYTIGLTIFYIGSGMMLVGVVLSRMPGGHLIAGLAALGKHSYSIYLWHVFLLLWGMPLLEGTMNIEMDPGSRLAIYFAGSLGVGVAMAKGIEVPTLRFRDRWFPSRGPAVVPV